MHITAINDNRITPFELTKDEQGIPAIRKLNALSALRADLARLDPATSGLATLEGESHDTSGHSVQSPFPAGWLHELWTPCPWDHATAMAWALSEMNDSDKPVLWVTSRRMLREQGMPYGPGLLALGLDPARFILARAASEQDGLWALEEGVKSAAFAGVIGELTDIDLTSSRRLSLAAQNHKVRCLLLMRSETEPQTVAYSRWLTRSGTDANAGVYPGTAHLQAALCKHRGGEHPHQSTLEWQDATHRFHMVASVADRPLVPGTQAKNRKTGNTDQPLDATG